MIELIIYLFISIGLQIVFFIPAYLFKTDKLTDLSYALSFIILLFVAILFNGLNISKAILIVMILAWAFRLGLFLFIRINKTKKDARFDNIRKDFLKFFLFWFFQGISVFVIMIPILIGFSYDLNCSGFSILGFCIWLSGFLIESFSDIQKFNFNKNPKNKDKWISCGLWKYSRHPNYFGEILCWIGLYVFVFIDFSLVDKILGLSGPLFISFLLVFVTGIPILERYADEKWGKDIKYKKYKKNTSILIPFFKG
ncbi:MAG TPA: DUF1295 domain-containing protein [Candidatus Woesearchaeota archaeon]|nr:DUF1295 domain-containing protein [Candidatus Woesearchaeota archaeon]